MKESTRNILLNILRFCLQVKFRVKRRQHGVEHGNEEGTHRGGSSKVPKIKEEVEGKDKAWHPAQAPDPRQDLFPAG